MTIEEFNALLEMQHYQCAICHNPIVNDVAFKNTYHVDHNHKTDRVRGILCSRCNTGLGQFRDSVEFLGNAIEYLNAHA